MKKPELKERLSRLIDNLTTFLIDNVGEDELWEDAYPEVDDALTIARDLLDSL